MVFVWAARRWGIYSSSNWRSAFSRISPTKRFWIAGVAAGLLVFAFLVLDRSKHVRFEIADGRLFVRGDIFCWRFPLSAMNLGPSVVLDLTQWPDFKPRRKIIGTSLPGYQSGEFMLQNGRRAIVFLSDLHRVLCILMDDGKFLLLSCTDPEGLLRFACRRETRLSHGCIEDPGQQHNRRVEMIRGELLS